MNIITILIPCYNEENNISLLYECLKNKFTVLPDLEKPKHYTGSKTKLVNWD